MTFKEYLDSLTEEDWLRILNKATEEQQKILKKQKEEEDEL